jgi:hypothetical protein
MVMKLRIAILLAAAGLAAEAQSSSGYVFFAPGGATEGGYTWAMLQTGGGVDAHIAKGIGVNLELSALGPKDDMSEAAGVFSAGGSYRFRRGPERRLEPFVAGGYSLIFREGHSNLYYFGGGASYWVSKKMGIRLEFRDQVSHVSAYNIHFWSFRIGVAFRQEEGKGGS